MIFITFARKELPKHDVLMFKEKNRLLVKKIIKKIKSVIIRGCVTSSPITCLMRFRVHTTNKCKVLVRLLGPVVLLNK